MEQQQRVFRTKEAARYVGLSPAWLERARVLGHGPRFLRLGDRAIGYCVDDLEAWLETRRAGDDDHEEPG